VLRRVALLGGFVALGLQPLLAEAQAPSELWFDLEPGPHPVGFAAWYEFDETREFFATDQQPPPGRPVRIFVWFPAESEARSQPPMRWGDYLAPPLGDGASAWTTAYQDFLYTRELDTSRRQFSPLSDEHHAALLATPVAARRDVAPAPGGHPLVLHSLGLGDFQQESTVLWEYLASHGYVVAVVPQVGPSAEDSGMDFDASDLRVQAEDLEFALAQVERTGVAATDRGIGVIGHSAGGIAALLLAAEESRVAAIVGLDASFSTGDGAALLGRLDLPYTEIGAAILDARAANKTVLDRSTLERLTAADRLEIEIGGAAPPSIATHFDFQNWPLYAALVEAEDDRGSGARSIEAGRTFYLSTVRLARSFLDAHLRHDRDAAARLADPSWIPGLDPTHISIRATPGR